MSQETPCAAILKQKCFFFSFYKIREQRAEQVLSGGLVPVGGGGSGEKAGESEYWVNTVYTWM
jgi:hypothetical protein